MDFLNHDFDLRLDGIVLPDLTSRVTQAIRDLPEDTFPQLSQMAYITVTPEVVDSQDPPCLGFSFDIPRVYQRVKIPPTAEGVHYTCTPTGLPSVQFYFGDFLYKFTFQWNSQRRDP